MVKSLSNNMKKKFSKGFTLIELMTAVSIFVIVMTVSMGALFGIFDANRKTRSIKTVMNNLNLAIESLSREMRYGSNYHCGGGTLTSPQNCSSGDLVVSFLSSGNQQITYRLNGSVFERQVGSGEYIPVIAPDVVIDSLAFYTFGALASDGLQPKTILKIKGHAGDAKSRSDFSLQTLISQRKRDS